ncbi:MAG: hypothetical protein R3192_15905 [Woeseiaceae bacterium]|nr:hypothetical protein [Woeseiaceae bacterium]
MFKRVLLGSAVLLTLLAGAAKASEDGKPGFAREIDSCIAEINHRADYDNATRVRHTVVEVKNTFAGYVLAISTDVFSKAQENAIREYRSYCVAKGTAKPKKFSIDRVDG